MSTCPDTDTLRRLLDESLGRGELEDLGLHLEDCPDCQERLRRLTEPDWGGLPILPPPRGLPIDAGSQGRRFRPLRPLGEGGLGVVSVARDAELRREVALKQIKAEYADDPGRRARFIFEAEVTGTLEHPGIVPVYGLGRDAEGRPYYAMRLIRRAGGPDRDASLLKAIERHHGPEADPEGQGLDLRGLLNRFVAACNAVAYAHSRGVLHRDLKPANILVGPYGETLVVDWGLAKVIDRQRAGGPPMSEAPDLGPSPMPFLTKAGRTLGTVPYASPEQSSGRLDDLGPASDVHGLGATLYHLVSGRPPSSEVEEEPPGIPAGPARSSTPRSLRALEAICRKAMARRPEERYPSATALAADVDRWLADEPVSVHREGVATRLARWGRRHRTTVVGLVAILMLVPISAALILAERARSRANFRLLNDVVFVLMEKVIEADLPDVPQADSFRREFAALMIGEAEKVRAAQPADAAIGRAVADVHRMAGNLARLQGDYAAAIPLYESSLDQLRDLRPRDSREAESVRQAAATLSDEGEALRMAGRLEEALAAQGRAGALLEGLSPWQREQGGILIPLSMIHINRGGILQETGDHRRGLESFGRALKHLDRMASRDDRYWRLYALALLGRAECLREGGAFDQAEGATTRVIRDLGEQESDPKKLREAAYLRACAFNLRGSLRAVARGGESMKDFEAALSRLTSLCRDHPEQSSYLTERAAALEGRGALRLASREEEEARADLEAARDILDLACKRGGDRHPTPLGALRQLGSASSRLATLARDRGEPGRASTLLDRAIQVQEEVVSRVPGRSEDVKLLGLHREARDRLRPAVGPDR